MSMCRVCKHDPVLAEWKAYWVSDKGRATLKRRGIVLAALPAGELGEP